MRHAEAPVRGRRSGVVALVLATSATAFAGTTDEVALLDVSRHVLKNGMRFLFLRWGDAPVIATHIRFDVGGVDDPKGQTGVAHLLEHMMFKGTTTIGTTDWNSERPVLAKLNDLSARLDTAKREGASDTVIGKLTADIAAARKEHERFVVKNEIWQIYDRCGGTGMNASTDNDGTQYYVQLPSNQFEVWCRVESDRIAHPVFREFYTERDVVHEERRLRTESGSRGIFSELFDMHAWLVHPYRQPVVGWPADIDGTRHDEVLEYFKTWYAPNNAVAVIVGDVDVDHAIELAEKYFGPIPAQVLPRRPNTPEPKQLGERRFKVDMEGDTGITIGWHVPAKGHADAPALSVASRVLSGSGGFGGRGRGGFGGASGPGAGRFRLKLVDELKVARRASASVSFGRYPGLFRVTASPGREKTIADVEPAVYAEIERLAAEPPTEAELARIKNSVASQAVRGLSSASTIASRLADAETLSGDWRQIEKDRELLLAVTADDVVRVVKTYLTPENRVVGVLQGPPDEDDREPRGEETQR